MEWRSPVKGLHPSGHAAWPKDWMAAGKGLVAWPKGWMAADKGFAACPRTGWRLARDLLPGRRDGWGDGGGGRIRSIVARFGLADGGV